MRTRKLYNISYKSIDCIAWTYIVADNITEAIKTYNSVCRGEVEIKDINLIDTRVFVQGENEEETDEN